MDERPQKRRLENSEIGVLGEAQTVSEILRRSLN